ncbi:tRNA (adenine-N1)-methyltransferase [Aeromicrobium sp. 636]|uniref:tRNA (adenine(58)-N(1))-methyltransferase TrmI n=1 Tax=Aeromicrobium senzhongii TaxID=2663859 RepID=A0A8I0JYL5_9ACTN|nr:MULTISPECIES: tRNA (adenine-N1)-methyltransferase [Aeromicrobium]MBC9225007.1 tRNA (adenine-N1)-methyltransferase [Aeromicrobium senzhongii]MCQ3997118.1 tRNA (adenine-N1)-methyltransferase [Aeromicrobium sp. 636]MTB87059.1 tRNA (adenine-N1)-methyltransferase [Aeromicrobium senzhongii]QNL93122.1 tRNA (adenine-N1)-methyltransferase [Aeromicrobium senzhongii]
MNLQRTGPFVEGEWIRLSDPKGRKHNIQLVAGKEFSTKKGQIRHDDIIGRPEGIVVETSLEFPYQVFRPLLFEYVVSMPRGAAIIYPKDAAQILVQADIFPGARVIEAGAGSGSLTTYLLRAIGPEGHLESHELREDFAETARKNVELALGGAPDTWSLTVGDLRDAADGPEVDRIILDMVDPWTCIPLALNRLVPGGIVCGYVATTTQLSRFVETLRESAGFTEPHAFETLVRDWHLEGLAVRPNHKMNGHTAFLVTARRLAPGQRPMPKTRRPAPGAYGPDYVGPRPADV